MAMKVIPADANHRIKYLYDEEVTGTRNGHPYKGIVIAIMGEGKSIYTSHERDVVDILTDYSITTGVKYTNLYLKESYKGISYCSVDDKFDLKEGMRIARDKVIKNSQKNLSNAMRAKADIQKILDKHSN